jgi:hypothetical protein
MNTIIAKSLSKAAIAIAIVAAATQPASAGEHEETVELEAATAPDFVYEVEPGSDTELLDLSALSSCAWGGIVLYEHINYNNRRRGFQIVYCNNKTGWREISLGRTSYNDRVSSFATGPNRRGRHPKVETRLHVRDRATGRRYTRGEAKWVSYVGNHRNDQISEVLICNRKCDGWRRY